MINLYLDNLVDEGYGYDFLICWYYGFFGYYGKCVFRNNGYNDLGNRHGCGIMPEFEWAIQYYGFSYYDHLVSDIGYDNIIYG